jgi:hypothetical protein
VSEKVPGWPDRITYGELSDIRYGKAPMTIESKRLAGATLDDVMASIGSAQDDLPSGQAGLVYAYEPVADQVCHLLREILSLRADKAKMMEAVEVTKEALIDLCNSWACPNTPFTPQMPRIYKGAREALTAINDSLKGGG